MKEGQTVLYHASSRSDLHGSPPTQEVSVLKKKEKKMFSLGGNAKSMKKKKKMVLGRQAHFHVSLETYLTKANKLSNFVVSSDRVKENPTQSALTHRYMMAY